MNTEQENGNIVALIIFIIVSLSVVAFCILSSLKQRKGKFVDTSDANLIKSDIPNIKIGFLHTSMIGKSGAIATDKNIILINKNTVDYYSIINKKGLGKVSSAFLHALAGHLVGCTVDELMGEKRRLLFMQLNNGKRLLIEVTGNYYDDYISMRCKKKKLADDDIAQVEKMLGHTIKKGTRR